MLHALFVQAPLAASTVIAGHSGANSFGSPVLTVERAMLGMPELLVVLAIVVVLFGATKLPQLGKGIGEAIGNFKKAQRDAERDSARNQEIDATPRLDRSESERVDRIEKDDHARS